LSGQAHAGLTRGQAVGQAVDLQGGHSLIALGKSGQRPVRLRVRHVSASCKNNINRS